MGWPVVLVAKHVIRMPPASVILNWALGCGRSFRMISRMPLGRPSSMSSVSSATQAPSRDSPSGSAAGVHAVGGILSTAWWIASVMVIPIEYDSRCPRFVSPWVGTDQRPAPTPIGLGQWVVVM